ncbi:DUF5682 family protein [Shewanella sp. A3A]|nr:DUF5682 family protein [Shewanella ferrihydritica]
MDEVISSSHAFQQRLAAISQQYDQSDICWLPVRHHSPACAAFALTRLAEFQPDIVLIEGPRSFSQHLPQLQRPEVVPPIAIYQAHSYFPLALNSPEWQALRWAGEQQLPVQFIDLDSSDQDDEQPQSRWSDARILSSEYSRQLQQSLGCRDRDELWLRLFEQQNFASATDFFRQVLLFCAASRLYYDDDTLAQLGDVTREQQMRASIKAAKQQYQRVAVLTGGFHTSALFDYADETAAISDNADDSYLIRYTDELLDAHHGYDAGMPYPAFCRWLFEQQHSNAADWTLFLLNQMPKLSYIDKQNTFEHLRQLCQLRGVQRASCFDLFDSLGSCLLKQQSSARDYQPWQQQLRGNNLGELPSDSRQLPLVEEVMLRCKQAKLTIGGTSRSHFALYEMTDAQRQRRQLLSQLLVLNLGFASYERGLGAFYNIHTAGKHESWQYQWTPAVEVALIGLSRQGATLDDIVRQHLTALPTDTLPQLFDKLVLSLQLGIADAVDNQQLQQYIDDCSSIQALTDCFIKLFSLSKHPLFAGATLSDLLAPLWRQLSFHLPALNQLEDAEALQLLLSLQAIARQQEQTLQQPWRERLQWLIDHNQHKPTLWFALKALALDLDNASPAPLLAELQQYSGDHFAVLHALITVVPHWLNRADGLLPVLNHSLEALDDRDFVEQLPKLRQLFCAMDARQIDGISHSLGELNQWQQALNWLNDGISEQAVQQGMALEQQLQQTLTQQGLRAWITH